MLVADISSAVAEEWRYGRPMVTTDYLVFLQLQKTGCSHIERLLTDYFSGKMAGKHHRLDPHTEVNGRLIVGSIRNPWDWYVSYWAFACQQKGGPYSRQTGPRHTWSVLTGRRPRLEKLPVRRGLRDIQAHALGEASRKPERWRRLYSDVNDPGLFREWLYETHDLRRRFDAFDDFGYSSLPSFAGLFTYLYCYLYLTDIKQLFDGRTANNEQLSRANQSSNLLEDVIRMEQLVPDFLRVVQRSGHAIDRSTREQLAAAPPTNQSRRPRDLTFFYDKDSSQFVRERDSLIIDSFDYATAQP